MLIGSQLFLLPMYTSIHIYRGDLTQTIYIHSALLLKSVVLFHIIVISYISLFK